MEMRTSAVSGIAHRSYLLTARYILSGTDEDTAEMGIQRGETVAMVNEYVVAVAAVPAAAGLNHLAVVRCLDRGSVPGADIDGRVSTPMAL